MGGRIKQIYTDSLNIIQGITSISGTPPKVTKAFRYFNIFNDQTDEMISGDTYSFATPALFVSVELGKPVQWQMGYTSYPECEIVYHIVNQVLDGGNGTMEQNLPIFDLRDMIKNAFNLNTVSYCSAFLAGEDREDFRHKSVYRYKVSFKTNFIDNVQGVYPETQMGYITDPQIVFNSVNLNDYTQWISGNSYLQNSIVVYRGNIYYCIVSNSDILFNPVNWVQCVLWTVQLWLYGSFCIWQNSVYVCINENSDSSFNISNWTLVS